MTSPMMGDRRVAWRTCPSRVGLLRDELMHAPTDSNLNRTIPEVHYYLLQGGTGVRWPVSAIVLHGKEGREWAEGRGGVAAGEGLLRFLPGLVLQLLTSCSCPC